MIKTELPQAPANLAAPAFLVDALRELTLLMKSYDTSLAPMESREDGFVKILEQALDPYLEGCDDLALKLSQVDQNIFCLNCLLAAQSTLEPFDFTVQRVGALQERISQCVEGLADHRHRWFLEESGLRTLLNALSEWQAEVSLRV
jgi:hypothetical protein